MKTTLVKLLAIGLMAQSLSAESLLDFTGWNNFGKDDEFVKPSGEETERVEANPHQVREDALGKIVEKDNLEEASRGTNYKVIDKEVFDKVFEKIKDEKVELSIDIIGAENGASSVRFVLNLNQWYVMRKINGIPQFIKYSPLNKSDFKSFESYLMVKKNEVRFLYKKGDDYKASRYAPKDKIRIVEVDKIGFKSVTYNFTFNYILKGARLNEKQ